MNGLKLIYGITCVLSRLLMIKLTVDRFRV